MKTSSCAFLLAIMVLAWSPAGRLAAQPRDLVASMAMIPGLAESPDSGAFVDIVKAMASIYPGKITIGVFPYARSFSNVLKGQADFHIPAMRNPVIPPDKLAYRYVSEKMGSLAMVLYSNRAKPLTRADLEKAVAKGGSFPYVIEVSAGAEANCPFPVLPTNDCEASLRKLALGRIDAIWNAQEETDLILRRLRLPDIRREFYGYYDDEIVIQKGERGDEVDQILSGLLRRLRASGKLDELYRKVHMPWDPWQPARMGW